MGLAPFAATGTLHIAGAASELASGAKRNLAVPERGPVGECCGSARADRSTG